MAKILTGKVVSTAMAGVAVVEVTRKTPHPLYKKLLKRSKKFKVALNGKAVAIGDTVSIKETRPMSKDMHFAFFEPEAKEKTKKASSSNTIEVNETPVKTVKKAATKKKVAEKKKEEKA